MAPNFPNSMKTINSQIQEAQRTSNTRNMEKKTHNYTEAYHNIILQNLYEKKLLKIFRKNGHVTYSGTKIKMTLDFFVWAKQVRR